VTRPPTSEGGRLLLAAGPSLREVAKRIRVAHQTVSTWPTTEARPGLDSRRKLASIYGIPVSAWDVPPGGTPPTPRKSADDSEAPIGTSLDEAIAMLARCKAQRVEAEGGDDPSLVLKWAELERRALDTVAKLRGDLSPADETRLTQTPRWAAVRACIIEALRPHPAARKDVITALRQYDAMGRAET
jgi:transcriptional regulator with XRE-family HTH domain